MNQGDYSESMNFSRRGLVKSTRVVKLAGESIRVMGPIV